MTAGASAIWLCEYRYYFYRCSMSSILGSPARKIYLVQPKFPISYWGLEHFLPITPYQAIFPPLGLLTLAALTPPDFTVTLCDENIGEDVDYHTDAPLICITGYIIQIERVFEIAERFRALGKTVVIGGPLANLLPDVCALYCDVLFEGEAEYTWPRFLRDYLAGSVERRYVETEKIHLPDSPPPRLDLLKGNYAHGIVQCTRGCPFSCEFCDIIVMYGRKMRMKPIEHVLQEIDAWQARGVPQVFFADDNFIGNRAYAKELLRALAQWNKRQRQAMSFYTQASIDMVRDEELLGLMRDANFVSVFIGIESPRKSSLAETRKTQNEKLDLVEAIHKIQSYNLFISAGMIVGFDNDDVSIFDDQYEFLQQAGIPIAMVSALMAVPKTPLYKRLKKAGRLIKRTRSSTREPSQYAGTNGGTNFHPLLMTVEELRHGQQELCRRLYAPKAFAERLLANVYRFKKVRYRPEALKWTTLRTFVRLARMYSRQGWTASLFFWSILVRVLLHSPRSLLQTINLLGMYQHFCKLLSQDIPWDPWAPAAPAPRVYSARVRISDGQVHIDHKAETVDTRTRHLPSANLSGRSSPSTTARSLP
jgi:radical SAM superfamily enzyme YgiQ (UPF0313 family)